MKYRVAKKVICRSAKGAMYRGSTLAIARSLYDRRLERQDRWFRDIIDQETVEQRADHLAKRGNLSMALEWLMNVPEDEWGKTVAEYRRKQS